MLECLAANYGLTQTDSNQSVHQSKHLSLAAAATTSLRPAAPTNQSINQNTWAPCPQPPPRLDLQHQPINQSIKTLERLAPSHHLAQTCSNQSIIQSIQTLERLAPSHHLTQTYSNQSFNQSKHLSALPPATASLRLAATNQSNQWRETKPNPQKTVTKSCRKSSFLSYQTCHGHLTTDQQQ